jgi:hypothetical protein
MKNRNLPRHLRRQLPSAEANFEGCYFFFCTVAISLFGTVFRKNCTAGSQSELRNFFMYITVFVIKFYTLL